MPDQEPTLTDTSGARTPARTSSLLQIDTPEGHIPTDQPSNTVVAGLKRLMIESIPSVRDIRFQDIVRSAGGLSRENWSLNATWTDASGHHAHPLMLLRDADGSLLNTGRSREFAVLKALESSPVPAPRVHWVDPDGRWLGAPSVVMDRVPGSCNYLVLNGPDPVDRRVALARRFTELMADIHAVDWRAHDLQCSLGLPAVAPSQHELAHWEREFRSAQLEPQPEMDYILKWLKRFAPEAEAIVLVHGDFKPGNALVEDGRITAKLDWETAHLGDPLEDLGWVTNPVRKREHQIEGLWEAQQIVEAYRSLTGRRVREADLLWWNVFSCWKLCVIQLTAVSEFVAGNYSRVFQTPTWLFRPMFKMMASLS
jgi:aminoglycoside phosphotransferase (APT) family kinase protein